MTFCHADYHSLNLSLYLLHIQNKTYNLFGSKSVEQAVKETEDKFGAYWYVWQRRFEDSH